MMNKGGVVCFLNNVKNGSVEAWIANKEIQWYNTVFREWMDSTSPEFHLNEYRIKPEPKYRPLTPSELIQYLGEYCQSYDGRRHLFILSHIGMTGVMYAELGTFKQISFEDLMNYRCRGTDLKKEIVQ